MTKTQQYKQIEKELSKVTDEIIANNYRSANFALNRVDFMLQEIEKNRLTKGYFDRFMELADIVDAELDKQ